MEKIKVLVIDSQIYFRTGIKEILSKESDIEIIDAAPDDYLIGLIEKEYPDVILLDTGPSSRDLALGKKLIQRYPRICLIILSTTPGDSELFDAVKIGAMALINKNGDPKDMIMTIREANRGKYLINDSVFSRPKIAEKVLQEFQHLSNPKTVETVISPITSRETQILTYICNGNSNKQIADILSISEQTIKNHVSSILRKLNANDRAHAAILAVRQGLIPLEDIQ